jgi:hypothetical protein
MKGTILAFPATLYPDFRKYEANYKVQAFIIFLLLYSLLIHYIFNGSVYMGLAVA